MNFTEIALARQSCRRYDFSKEIETTKLTAVLESARLAPSACNGQPYHFTVVTGEKAKDVVEEAYCSTLLCLLGNKAMEEQRLITFPEEYKIPYMKF